MRPNRCHRIEHAEHGGCHGGHVRCGGDRFLRLAEDGLNHADQRRRHPNLGRHKVALGLRTSDRLLHQRAVVTVCQRVVSLSNPADFFTNTMGFVSHTMVADEGQQADNVQLPAPVDFDRGHRSFDHGRRQREDGLGDRSLFLRKGYLVLRSRGHLSRYRDLGRAYPPLDHRSVDRGLLIEALFL